MDVVLEIWDTFLADHVFAKVFPAQATPPFEITNGALSNHTTAQALLPWQYSPATTYWTLEPPEAAYLTSVPRDNIWRQLASLYTITVSVDDQSPGVTTRPEASHVVRLIS